MKKNLLLLFSTLVVSVLALEVLVRAYVFDPNVSYIRTPGWEIDVFHNDLLANVKTDHTIKINKYGLRGEEPRASAQPLVGVIGGSTVEDWVLPEKHTWAEQLQRNLSSCSRDVDVINMGKAGTNGRHNLLQLKAYEEVVPHLDKLIILIGLNDFLFDNHIHHSFEVGADWWRQQAFMSLGESEGRIALVALAKRFVKLYEASNSGQRPQSHFGVYQESLRAAYRKVKSDNWVNEIPDQTENLDVYEQTIHHLADFAREKGTDVYFVTQPFLWSDNMSSESLDMIYAGFIGSDLNSKETKWYTVQALKKGLGAYNDRLLQVCADNNLNCIDLAGKLPKVPLNYYDDFHFSAPGAENVAKIVSTELLSKFGFCNS